MTIDYRGISPSQKPYPHMGVPNAYTQLVLFRLYCSAPEHPEPAQSTSNQRRVFAKHSIQVGRINLEPSQATASKHWSLHSVRVKVRVRTANLNKTNWVYALGTPIWAYGIAPGVPPKSTFCIIFCDILEESKWYIADEHERDLSAASTQQQRKVLV